MARLFVGNISFQITESDLRSAFEPFGELTSIQIMTDRDTGRSRGFAFVEMGNQEQAAKAIAGLNGTALNGRTLAVNEARPRAERGTGGRGGDHRFARDDYSGAARKPREPRW